MSNEMLVTASHTPGPSPPTRASIPAKKLTTFRWQTITPFGRPVEPDVKMTYARFAGGHGGERRRVGAVRRRVDVVDPDDHRAVRRERRLELRLRHQHRRLRVFEHPREALRG